ncbi:MAG: hypothetical protein ABJA80_05260 [bacterium]
MNSSRLTAAEMCIEASARLARVFPDLSPREFEDLLGAMLRIGLAEQVRLSAVTRRVPVSDEATTRIAELHAEVAARIRHSCSHLSLEFVDQMAEDLAIVAYQDEQRIAGYTQRVDSTTD